ncbi:[formate-C-acetyltransferase]-activating enzyme [Pseudaeromonas sp. ZJS20]|uniref:[formate-C-acetyltransferase]-activating enzyme n=1 Tax=Pseudaeromonas aegiceratis TaxID=3153928 RepID=UPI00390C539A
MTSYVAPPTSSEVIPLRAETARIFNIQRYSLNDGQGIRTLVFFKGCPHRCPWCANPESISGRIQFVRREARCLHCTPCLRDAQECPSGAFEQLGRDVTLGELEQTLLKDEVFFRSSGGGVTLSGGEVLLQAEFASRLLASLRRQGIHTAIETAGDAPWPRLLSLAQQCDEVLFDLKILDAEQSRQLLRLDLDRVLANLAALVRAGIRVIPRVPLIPGFTLTPANLERIFARLTSLGLTEVHLLPFHRYGEPKYTLLGKRFQLAGVAEPDPQTVAAVVAEAEALGLRVTLGG